MDTWEQVEKQIASIKAEYLKYTQENPILLAKNVELRKEVTENNRQIALAHGELEDIEAKVKELEEEIRQRKIKVDIFVQEKIDGINQRVDETNKECATRLELLDERAKSLDKRESDVEIAKKVNVAKASELDASKELLEKQAEEIKLATKTLNNKAIDNKHEEDVLLQRGVELDTRETSIVKVEADIHERIKLVEQSENNAQDNLAKSRQLLDENNDIRTNLDRREVLMKNSEIDLKNREQELKKRTDMFINSMRTGKMI